MNKTYILISHLFFTCFLLITGELHCQNNCPNQNGYRLPAEFEELSAVWISWSSEEAKKNYPYSIVQKQIISHLSQSLNVKVVVQNSQELEKAQQDLQTDPTIIQSKISFHPIESDNIWIRDIGPVFLINSSNALEIAAFNFDNWGHLSLEIPSEKSRMRNQLYKEVAPTIAKQMGLNLLSSNLISEAGNRESNGKGTMLVVSEVDRQRNPHLTDKEIKEELQRVLGVKKLISLKKGMCQDDFIELGPIDGPTEKKEAFTLLGNGGHIDAFCRFVGPNTIVLAEVDPRDIETDPIARENSIRLEENFKILSHATDQDGQKFNIIRMPATDSFYVTLGPGDSFYDYLLELKFPFCKAFPDGKFPNNQKTDFLLTTSYLNFLIANDCVLLPHYWKKGLSLRIKEKDEKAFRVIQSIFPQKKIIPIDVYNLNLCGGGIHCLTQTEPSTPSHLNCRIPACQSPGVRRSQVGLY